MWNLKLGYSHLARCLVCGKCRVEQKMISNTWQYCDCLFDHRLKAEIEKVKLEYEETATQEQQKHSNEVKVSLSLFKFSDCNELYIKWNMMQISCDISISKWYSSNCSWACLFCLFFFLHKHERSDRVLINVVLVLLSDCSDCFVSFFSGTYREASWCRVKRSGFEEWGNWKFISFVA